MTQTLSSQQISIWLSSPPVMNWVSETLGGNRALADHFLEELTDHFFEDPLIDSVIIEDMRRHIAIGIDEESRLWLSTTPGTKIYCP